MSHSIAVSPLAAATLDDAALAAYLDSYIFTQRYYWLTPDNRRGNRISRETALSEYTQHTPRPWFAEVREDATAIDFDLSSTIDLARALQPFTAYAAAHYIPHLVVPSGGGVGRAHLLLFSRDPAITAIAEAVRLEHHFSAVQVDIKRCLRGLSSVHRSGSRRDLATLRQQVASWTVWPTQPSREPAPRTKRLPTTKPPREHKAAGDPAVPYGPATRNAQPHSDRSHNDALLTWKLRGTGYSARCTWEALTSRGRNDLHGHAVERGYTWWHRHMWSKYDPAKRGARTDSRWQWSAAALPMVAALRARRRASMTTKEAYSAERVIAMLARLFMAASTPAAAVPASVRTLSQGTGLHVDTVMRALASLRSLGIIKRTARYSYTRALAGEIHADEYAPGVPLFSANRTPSSHTPQAHTLRSLSSRAHHHLLTLLLTPEPAAPARTGSARYLHQLALQELTTYGILRSGRLTTLQRTTGSAKAAHRYTTHRAKYSRERDVFTTLLHLDRSMGSAPAVPPSSAPDPSAYFYADWYAEQPASTQRTHPVPLLSQ